MLADVAAALAWLFGGDVPREPLLVHQVCARAIVVYFVGIAIVRIGKSRLTTPS